MMPESSELKPTQIEIDIKNLRFYAAMFRQYEWETDMIHFGVFEQTLREIAQRIAAMWAELDALRASTDAFRQRHPIPKSVPITTVDDPRIELLRRLVTPNDLGETAANSLVALIEENEGLRGRS